MKKIVFFMVMVLACFVGFSGYTKCDASANIKFQATNVYLYNGKSVIEGNFYNEGDSGATVTTVKLSFTASDKAGNYVFSDSGLFSGVNAWVPAYGTTAWSFTINNSNTPGYAGTIKWHIDADVRFSY